MNDPGLRTHPGTANGFLGVQIRVHKVVPSPNPVPFNEGRNV